MSQANDSDQGVNGEVRYKLDMPLVNPPPFNIDEVEGRMYTTTEFSDDDKNNKYLPYKLIAEAHDRGQDVEGFKSIQANCYVSGKYFLV